MGIHEKKKFGCKLIVIFPLETLYVVTQHMSEEELAKRTISLDCDTIYFSDILTPSRQLDSATSACVYFEDSGINAVFSYITLNDESEITGIREKVAISRNANTGAYVFRSGDTLRYFVESILDGGVGRAGEYYTSSIIADMVTRGEKFKGIQIAKGDFYCVGTPDQLDDFLQIVLKNPSMVKKRRFCFDLDNTLVTMPIVSGDYSTCQPKWNNVNLCKQLKSAGHYIIIHTARRMKTHKGNIGAVIRDVGMITIKQLEDLEIEYDELHFGKPWAHLYIDDLAVSALLDTGKEIGWYAPHEKLKATKADAAVNARSFNMVQSVGDKVIKTSAAASIDGEAFFHAHIPDDVSNLFPKLYALDYNEETRQTSISMHKVQGVTFSHLLVGAGLTPGRFNLLLQNLHRLHSSSGFSSRLSSFEGTLPFKHTGSKLDSKGDLPIDIYSNYQEKAVSRVRSYSSVYDTLGFDYESALQVLVKYFTEYQQEGRGIPSKVIHGDPVFSNVLITKDSHIQFIDMRGRVGNTLTLQGDAMYDLAKVYQSVRGYDYIILDRDRNNATRLLDPLRKQFWDWISVAYAETLDVAQLKQDILAATALLVFTLIPLHDNLEHHQQFASMFKDIMEEARLVF
jgi:capsule biosynthesis phosphatase